MNAVICYMHLLRFHLDFHRTHKEFYTILYHAGMTSIMQETILNAIQITPEMANTEAYMKSFWAYGIFGRMIEWMKRGMPDSGRELLKFLTNTKI